MKITPIILLTLVSIAGCSGGEKADTQSNAAGPASTPTADHIANAIYEGVYDFAVKLHNGVFEGEPYVENSQARPRVDLIDQLVVFGDLNADGVDDAAALLSETSGGTGNNIYLAAVFVEGSKIRTQVVLVGDRVQIRSLRIHDRAIRMEIVETGPGDAMCCPTQMASKTWQPGRDALQLTDSQVTGKFSPQTLAGSSWRLTHIDFKKPAPAEPSITLEFGDGKVSGTSGCNRYFAQLTDHDKGQIAVGPAGSTQMACPEPALQLEQTYLNQLQASVKMSFWLGHLAVTFRTDDVVGMMLFDEAAQENDEVDDESQNN